MFRLVLKSFIVFILDASAKTCRTLRYLSETGSSNGIVEVNSRSKASSRTLEA